MQSLCLELHQVKFQSQSVVHCCGSVLVQIPWLLESELCPSCSCSSSFRKKFNCWTLRYYLCSQASEDFCHIIKYPLLCWEQPAVGGSSSNLPSSWRQQPCAQIPGWLQPSVEPCKGFDTCCLHSLQQSSISFLAFHVFCDLNDNVGQEGHRCVSF